ncbi:MAG TPA: HU family DNA-binding protein [Smithellaceae bacterium]|nr:HU family DNA-binding protein [Smithellaceae bacterium]
MTKTDLIIKTKERLKVYSQKDIAYSIEIIFNSMTEALKKNERIEIRGFGNFTIRERKARIGRNPKSGASVALADRKVPFFKTGKDLRLKVDR